VAERRLQTKLAKPGLDELTERGSSHAARISATLMKVGDTRLYIENGVRLIMLHGFPEFWWSWRQQIPELARKGFLIVAVDMRGYGTSDAVLNVQR
jgi:pimeloyl-ACP methyl ester carboxylesterase